MSHFELNAKVTENFNSNSKSKRKFSITVKLTAILTVTATVTVIITVTEKNVVCSTTHFHKHPPCIDLSLRQERASWSWLELFLHSPPTLDIIYKNFRSIYDGAQKGSLMRGKLKVIIVRLIYNKTSLYFVLTNFFVLKLIIFCNYSELRGFRGFSSLFVNVRYHPQGIFCPTQINRKCECRQLAILAYWVIVRFLRIRENWYNFIRHSPFLAWGVCNI